MFFAYMTGRAQGLFAPAIAEGRVSLEVPAIISTERLEDIQMVFNKLSEAVNVQKNVSAPLVTVLSQIEPNLRGRFIDSFVHPATHGLMQTLRADHPGAIECKRIWAVDTK